MTDWREGLTHKDWMLDGSTIRTERAIERFNHLDWSKAWVDIGPSIAGNLGPYWHVPMDDGETVHRLYPKVLASKWLLLIRQACEDYAKRKLAGYWQPMITAPTDGTHVLVVDDGIVSEAYYHIDEKSWWLAQTGPGDFDPSDAIYPTFWQPKPEAPPSPIATAESKTHGESHD